jgi:hypothetical protein
MFKAPVDAKVKVPVAAIPVAAPEKRVDEVVFLARNMRTDNFVLDTASERCMGVQ